MIKACVFDLDGTLLDTVKGITYYINKQMKRRGLAPITEAEAMSFLGHGAYDLIAATLRSRGVTDTETVSEVLREYNADYDGAPTYLVAPYPGITEAVDALIERGIKVAVLSNKPDFATRAIVKHYFGDKFTAVRGAVDGVPLKPEPDSLYAIMETLGVSADECAFVGDTEFDVLTARNAGTVCIAVGWGFRTKEQLKEAGADIIAEHPLEILNEI